MNQIDELRFFGGEFNLTFYALEISGPDSEQFLHGQCTQDIRLMPDNSFSFSALLQHQGKVEALFIVLKTTKNKYTLLLPPDDLGATKTRLEKFLISEEVEIHEASHECILKFGPITENKNSFQGVWADETIQIELDKQSMESRAINELTKLEQLNGQGEFKLQKYLDLIINNTIILSSCVSFKKGCFPGQETVAKIHNNRGAAFAPMLLEINTDTSVNLDEEQEIRIFDKKIGTISAGIYYNEKFYYPAMLLRDYRVHNLKIDFPLHGQIFQATVLEYPLLSGKKTQKATELLQNASLLHSQNKSEEAIKLIDIAIKISPKLPDLYESKGVILGQMGKFDEAIIEMNKLLDVDATSVLAHTNKSLFLMKQGKIQEAEDEKALATVKSFAKFGEEAKTKKLLEEQKLKDKQEREKRFSMFQQVLEIDPDDTLANFGLGSFYYEEKKLDLAQTHLEKVLTQDQKYSNAYLFLGKTLIAKNDKKNAKEVLEAGVKVAAARGDLMPANEMNQLLRNL